jgi:hypothetical protein
LLARLVGAGDVAQLVEHLLCKQGVGGSSPLVSTRIASDQHRCTEVRRLLSGSRPSHPPRPFRVSKRFSIVFAGACGFPLPVQASTIGG